MPRISNILPLPGVSELESAGRGLLRLLKDADIEQDKRITLSRRLESLIGRANELKNLPEVTSQLLVIQKQFESVDASGSRLGFRASQRKMIMWDELKAKLDETIEMNMLDLWAEIRRDAHASPAEYKVIPRHKILDEVEVSTWTRDDSWIQELMPCAKTHVALRTGRLKKTSVVYVTFVPDSQSTARELVENEIKILFQLQHLNVAKFVGVTPGYSGPNGIVVAMDGMEINQFMSRTHSGAVWAECIRGFENFAKSAPKWIKAKRITVAHNGHVMIFPGRSGQTDITLSGYHHRLKGPEADHGVKMLMWMYSYNYESLGSTCFRAFVDALAKLGLGFTKLHVMKIAADCGLFPGQYESVYGGGFSLLPHSPPKVGEFGVASFRDGYPVGWESLGRSRHVEHMDFCAPPKGSDCSFGLELFKSVTSDGAEWLTYVLRDLPSRTGFLGFTMDTWRLARPYRFSWNDIFTEAQEMSERLNVDLGNISFVCSTASWATLDHKDKWDTLFLPGGPCWDVIPTTLYYHWNPQSPDPQEARGFYSANKTPDGGVSLSQFRSQGWTFGLLIFAYSYRISDDWGLQYER